jgi:hypothetical protein
LAENPIRLLNPASGGRFRRKFTNFAMYMLMSGMMQAPLAGIEAIGAPAELLQKQAEQVATQERALAAFVLQKQPGTAARYP